MEYTPPPPDRPSNLGEVAYERMAAGLMGGQFRAGTKLTVRAVADTLGISTTPARDAINRLISEGALVNLGPKTVVLPKLTSEKLDEITKIRLALEGLASFEATPNISPKDLDQLEHIELSLEAAFIREDYSTALALNKDFHFFVYRRSNMPQLVAMIATQWLRIGPFLNEVYPLFKAAPDRFSTHQWIIAGLKNRDGFAVRAGFEHDVRTGQRALQGMLS